MFERRVVRRVSWVDGYADWGSVTGQGLRVRIRLVA